MNLIRCGRLETDLQALEQHLESMRAVYQLNQEKLDYNCSVLSERENENSSTISQQKRRLSSFQSALSALKVGKSAVGGNQPALL